MQNKYPTYNKCYYGMQINLSAQLARTEENTTRISAED